jgi:hypothetical protein
VSARFHACPRTEIRSKSPVFGPIDGDARAFKRVASGTTVRVERA